MTNPFQTLYIVPLKEAKEATKRWRATHKVHAFAIDEEEIKDILREPEVNAVRVYFGLDENGYERMFLVAAKKVKDKHGKVVKIIDLIDENTEALAVKHHVFDLTKPCPPTCDDESVMN